MTTSVLNEPADAGATAAELYDYLPVGHHSVNAAGVFTQMNEIELRWLGYTREEVIGRLRVTDVLSAAARRTFELNFARLVRDGCIRDVEYEFMRKDGTTFTAVVNALATRNEHGQCLGGRAVVVDISARKNAERALRRSEASLRQAQRIAHIGNYEMDCSPGASNSTCHWSEETYRILGRDPALGPASSVEFVKHYIHAEDRARVMQVIETAFRGGGPADCEYRIVRGDGDVRYVRDVAEPLYGADGRIERYFGVIHDVTDARLAQRRALESERRFRHLVENSHDGMVLLAADGKILYASPSVERLLGRAPDAVVGRCTNEFCHPDDLPGVASVMEQLVSGRQLTLRHEFRVRHADGSWRWIEACRSNRLHDPALNAIVCNFRDVTGQHDARENLRSANRRLQLLSQHLQQVREDERTRLARELHDELGATLSTINLYLDTSASPEQGVAPEALTRARALVDAAMDATRSITTRLRPGILDHRGLWAAIEWLADEASASGGLACLVQLDAVREVAPDAATSTAVFRIVQEALRNAVQHAGASLVRLSAQREQQDLLLRIADDGRGIAEDRCNKTNSWGITGMRERARALGGDVAVQRTAERGTLVELRVPLSA